MPAKILILVFFITYNSLVTKGQDHDLFDIRVKAHPLALISMPRPTILTSVEFRYKKIGVDFGYGQQYAFLLSSDPDTVRVNNFGNRYRLDFRYYLKPLKSDSLSFPFISFYYSKIYSSVNITTDWFSGYKFDPSYAIVDNIHVFSVNYGLCNYFKRIVLETTWGTGVRLRTAQSLNSKGKVIKQEKQVLPHLNIAFRIGYII